jgi:hypothetical protein
MFFKIFWFRNNFVCYINNYANFMGILSFFLKLKFYFRPGSSFTPLLYRVMNNQKVFQNLQRLITNGI